MLYPIQFPAGGEPCLTLTNPKSHVWVIEMHNGADNRLTTTMIDKCLKPALDVVEKHWRERWRAAQQAKSKDGGSGSLIITGKQSQDKFFSNGFDYVSVISNPNFFADTANPLLIRLLTFPIPCIAAINGHCFAAGMILSLSCDYRIMTDGSKRNAWITMNEVHFGAPWPLSFAHVMKAKVTDVKMHRKIALEGHRFNPKEALEAGIVDAVVNGNSVEIMNTAIQLADKVAPLAHSGVYGLIKADIYRDTVKAASKDLRIIQAVSADATAKARL